MHLACLYGYDQVVELLLQYGANPETEDISGPTPLWNACLSRNVALILMLLNAGASIYQQNRNGLALLQDPNIHQEYRDILYEHHRNISLFNLLLGKRPVQVQTCRCRSRPAFSFVSLLITSTILRLYEVISYIDYELCFERGWGK